MKKLITILIVLLLVVSCKQPINETYNSKFYENQQKVELVESGVDSLTIAMIDFEIKHNESLDGVSLEEISKMGQQRLTMVISEIKEEFQTAKNNNQSTDILLEVLKRLYVYAPNDEVITSGLIYIETLKLSTINGISLEMDIKDVKGAKKSKDKDSLYDLYFLKNTEINKLKGKLLLYVKNHKIEKIKFNSSKTWLGATSVASYMFKEFLNERRKWVQNAMSYYEIPDWQDGGDFYVYNYQGIIHQYSIEKVQAFGVSMGYNLIYIITSESAVKNETQTKTNNLKF